MRPIPGRGLTLVLVVLWIVPGVASAQSLDPSAVTETTGQVRAVGSFLLVFLCGGAILHLFAGFVDRSTDALLERPAVAVVYGLLAYVIVGFFGAYATDLLVRSGLANTPAAYVAPAILFGGSLVLGAVGFVVLGTVLTDLWGHRQPQTGLVVGAAVSAAAWLAFPLVGSVLSWVVVSAVGIGGATRRWVHASEAVEVDP